MDLHPIAPLSPAHSFVLHESRAEVHCQVLSALLTQDQATPPIGLTPSPFLLHGWSGLSAALKQGRIDRQRIQRTLASLLVAVLLGLSKEWHRTQLETFLPPETEETLAFTASPDERPGPAPVLVSVAEET